MCGMVTIISTSDGDDHEGTEQSISEFPSPHLRVVAGSEHCESMVKPNARE